MNHFGQALNDVSSHLYRINNEIDEMEGGMGVDFQTFAISIIAGMKDVYPDIRPLDLYISARSPEGKGHLEVMHAFYFEDTLYNAWGEKTMDAFAQDAIDFFLVGEQDEGEPLPEGWTLSIEERPFNSAADMMYDDVVEDVKNDFDAFLAEHEAQKLEHETVAPGQSLRNHRL